MPTPTKISSKPKTIPERIRTIRGELSQANFAEKLNALKMPRSVPKANIAQAMVSRYEKGIETPSPFVLLRIARAGGTSIEWVLTGLKGKAPKLPKGVKQ